ncbi:MAG TPA: MDR family MFS transporter [Pseudonocardia sp.]|nr:MDR family MFS transporter [Pseudonocardia sp.]
MAIKALDDLRSRVEDIKTLDDLRARIEDVFLTEVEPDTVKPETESGADPDHFPESRGARERVDTADPVAPAPDAETTSEPAAADIPAADTSADSPEESNYINKWGLPLAVVVIGMFMSVLDTSIVNVAVPAMQKAFNVNSEDIQWVATAYTLCLGVIVPTSAWLGERFGMRRLYVWSLVGFAVFSGLCGVCGDLGPMIAFRILQAIPGGIIPVLCLGILTRIVPPKELGAAMGMYGFGMVVAPGVGPALGGYLVEYVDWRLIFMINVPIGLLGAVAARFILPELPGRRGKSFDTWGFVTVAAGLFAVLLAVSKGADWGWTSYPVLILLVGSGLLLALFVIIELEVDEPLLNVRSFARWHFVNSLVLAGVLSLGLFGTLYFIPVFLQVGQNITPMHTGLAILPQAVVMMVLMPVSGKLYDRFGARWPVVAGTFVSGVGLMLMGAFDADTTLAEVVVWTMIQAGGLALAFMPAMTAGLAALPEHLVDAGNSYTNLVQRVAGALGLSAITALTTHWGAEMLAGYKVLLQDDGAQQIGTITNMENGPAGLMPMYGRMQLFAQAHSYSNAFLMIGLITCLASLLALFLKTGRPEAGEKPAVEMG